MPSSRLREDVRRGRGAARSKGRRSASRAALLTHCLERLLVSRVVHKLSSRVVHLGIQRGFPGRPAGRGMKRAAAGLLLTGLLLALCGPRTAEAKPNSRVKRALANRRRECERKTCANQDEDHIDNCILRCLSPACYDQVYADDELEPGEIDATRYRSFQTCTTLEERKRKWKFTGRNVPPQPREATHGGEL